jgi:hypothetical protein
MPQETKISPKGECMFAHLFNPRTIKSQDGPDKSQYGIVLIQANPERDPQVAEFIKGLHAEFTDKFGVSATYGPNGKPWKKEIKSDPATGQETLTGLTKISFNRDTQTRGGAILPPPSVEDAAGNPWPSTVAIGNGSVVRVGFSIYLWDSPRGGKGMSLNLLGVRVIEHVPYVPPTMAPGSFGPAEAGVDCTTNAIQALAGGGGLGASDVPWDDGPASTEEILF